MQQNFISLYGVSADFVKKTLLALVIAFLFSACSSTVEVSIPRHRFDSPEVGSGDNRIRLSGTTHRKYEVEIAQVESTTFANTHSPRILHSEGSIDIAGTVSLSKNWELFLHSPFSNSGRAGAKYQLIGKTEKQAKKGDFSLSATLALWVMSKSKSTDSSRRNDDSNFKNSEKTSEANIKTSTSDIALIAGYRLSDKNLLYGGPFISSTNIDSEIKLTESDDLVEFKGRSIQSGANLGFSVIERNWSFTAETVYSRVSYNQNFKSVIERQYSLGIQITIFIDPGEQAPPSSANNTENGNNEYEYIEDSDFYMDYLEEENTESEFLEEDTTDYDSKPEDSEEMKVEKIPEA